MDTKQYMDLLKRGPQVWNDWRARHPEIRPNFHEEDLSEVLLRNTDLHEVDLTQVHGLTAEQLGGANLSGAQLPATLQKFERLAEVDAIAQNGQKLLFSLLLACLYSWLTVATTTDVRLLTDSISSPLPLVGTAIPIVGFYIVAPLILFGLYLYCHLYLQRYWEALAALPAVFPDGRSLDKRTYPWLLSDFVHSHFASLKKDRFFLSPLQVWLPALLAWAVAPLTLFFFWGRYLSRHGWYGTILHTLLLAMAIGFGVFSCLLARSTLHSAAIRHDEHSHRVFAASIGAFLFTFITFLLLSFGVIYGAPPSDPFDPNPRNSLAELVPRALSFLGFAPFADFTGADVSGKPENWNETESKVVKSGKETLDKPEGGLDVCAAKDASGESASSDETPIKTVISTVKGAHLKNRNLRYAMASHAFLVNADLRDADLRGANFTEADLRGANLEGADLRGAILLNADLREADLRRANLWGAYLGYAQLQKARLQGASLGDAILEYAQLQGAQLQEDKLSDSRYRIQEISGADLQHAKLWGADFSKATLQGVKFWKAELYGAKFIKAHLEHAQFQESVGDADFSHACRLGAYLLDGSLYTAEKTTQQPEFAIKGKKTPTPDFTEQHEEQLLGVARQ